MKEENPYASPGRSDEALDEPLDASSSSIPTQVLLTSFLGLQAGGMLGLLSGLLAPLRYLLGPVPFETVLLEDLSSKAYVQIIGESIFIAGSCLIFGATFGAVFDLGEKFLIRPLKGSNWFLLNTLKIHRISGRGILFAFANAAPLIIILTASHLRSDPFLWLHGLWALAHFLLSIYFGERFAEAWQRAEKDSIQPESLVP